MFTTPAVDPLPLAALLGCDGGFARWTQPRVGQARVRRRAADDRARRGDRRRRARARSARSITSAGNPVLSAPGGPALERALGQLDFMVSIDPYLNETTRLAHVILPPTSPLERSHYDVALNAFAVRNVAKYSPPLFERAARRAPRLGDLRRPVRAPAAAASVAAARRARARQARPRGDPRSRAAHRSDGIAQGLGGLSLAKLRAAPHGIDLGPLESRLPERLGTRDRKVAPRADDLPRRPRAARARGSRRRPRARDDRPPPPALEQLVAAQQRAPREGPAALHADDPSRRCRGARARRRRRPRGSRPRTGAIELPVEITDTMMQGVVSVPHGWGHDRARRAAARRATRRRARASTTSSIRRASTRCRARAR